MPINQEKLMVLKVKGRFSNQMNEEKVAGFHGLTAQTTKRVHVGESFEILATPYKPTKFYFTGVHEKNRQKVDGDARAAQAEWKMINHNWTQEMADLYCRFQYFNPDTMEMDQEIEPAMAVESEELPNDYLLSMDEKAAIKAIKKEGNPNTLKAWLDAEKINAKGARPKVVEFLEDSIEN